MAEAPAPGASMPDALGARSAAGASASTGCVPGMQTAPFRRGSGPAGTSDVPRVVDTEIGAGAPAADVIGQQDVWRVAVPQADDRLGEAGQRVGQIRELWDARRTNDGLVYCQP